MARPTGLLSRFQNMAGMGLPEASHSNDTRRPTPTDLLRGTVTNDGGTKTKQTSKLLKFKLNLPLLSI